MRIIGNLGECPMRQRHGIARNFFHGFSEAVIQLFSLSLSLSLFVLFLFFSSSNGSCEVSMLEYSYSAYYFDAAFLLGYLHSQFFTGKKVVLLRQQN